VINSVVGDVNKAVQQASNEPAPSKRDCSGTLVTDQEESGGEEVEDNRCFEDIFDVLRNAEKILRLALRRLAFLFLLVVELVGLIVLHADFLGGNCNGTRKSKSKNDTTGEDAPKSSGQKKSVTRLEESVSREHVFFFYLK
jgi:hypothetical protein